MTASSESQLSASGLKRPRYALYAGIAIIAIVVLVLVLYLLPVPVNGQVRDADTGQPVADASVALSNGTEARSDAQGRFAVRASRFQPFSATINEAAYRPWEGAAKFSPLPLAPAALLADLQPTVLQGQVVNAVDGQPVPGVMVTVDEQTATADDEGRFEMRRLPRQGAKIALAADQFISYERELANWPADGSQPVSLPIYPNGLHGTITDAATGQPLAGVSAALNGDQSASLETGFFYLPTTAGKGDVRLNVPGYLPATVSVDSDAALQGQESIDVSLEPTVLAGVVTDGQTGEPVAGVTVSAGGQMATTDDQGRYRIERLHGADLKLAGQLDGYEPAEQAIDEAANLLDGQPLDLVLMPPHLAGRIVNEVTDGPVASATVKAGDLSATTGEDGQFVLWTTDVPLQVAVSAVGYEDATAEFAEDAELSVALKPKGVVVTVTDNAGQPVSGVLIQGPRSEATTDAQGIALLPLLEAGEVFTATAENFAPLAQPFDGANQQQLSLSPDTMAGRAVDAGTGEPVLGAIIYVYDKETCQGEACRGTEPVVIVDAAEDGSFEATGMPANPEVMVKAPGYSLLFPDVLEPGDCGAPYCLEARMEPFEARGFYVPFHYLYDRALITSRLDLIEQSPILNAVVVDMKSDYGEIAWDPENEIARDIGVYQEDLMSAQEFLQEAKKRGIYTIARFVTFKDNALAEGRPEWAVRRKAAPNELYRDGENLAWVDPYREEVQQYEIDLAKELAELGFDELQFDYFRFDGGESLDFIGGAPSRFIFQVESTVDNRRETISGFADKLMESLKPYGVFTAVDVFGNIILVGREPIIGQDLQEIAVHLDYLNPMIYPQVWGPETFTECGDPALCPYKVIYDSTSIIRDIVPLPTRIRPWLQGYGNNYRRTGPAAGYNYDVAEMMIQRQAAEDAGAEGWLFWSGGGRFPDEIFGPMPSLAELEAQVRARQGGRSGPY